MLAVATGRDPTFEAVVMRGTILVPDCPEYKITPIPGAKILTLNRQAYEIGNGAGIGQCGGVRPPESRMGICARSGGRADDAACHAVRAGRGAVAPVVRGHLCCCTYRFLAHAGQLPLAHVVRALARRDSRECRCGQELCCRSFGRECCLPVGLWTYGWCTTCRGIGRHAVGGGVHPGDCAKASRAASGRFRRFAENAVGRGAVAPCVRLDRDGGRADSRTSRRTAGRGGSRRDIQAHGAEAQPRRRALQATPFGARRAG